MPAAVQEPSGRADASLILELFLNHLQRLYPDTAAQGTLTQLRTELETAIRGGTLAETRDSVLKQLSALGKPPEDRQRPASKSLVATDPCTGLPMRPEAEEMLRHLPEQGKQAYAVVFYLHRMALTNARFGESIGNQVILFCSQHIATAILRANDSLFRWQGPAFVAIIERPESLQAVNSEIQRLATAPISRHFETPSRSVYLPIRLTSEVVPLLDTNVSDVLAQIGRFILNTSGQAQSERD